MVKIVIVGGGASGLAAAAKLVKEGFNFQDLLILEAQDRIGGRIHTVVENGKVLEIGAQWVHGEDGNVVHEMASAAHELNDEQSWESSGLGDDVVFSYDCGEEVPKDEVEEILHQIESIKLNSTEELGKFAGSLGQYFISRFTEKMSKDEKLSQDTSLGLAVLDWYHLMQNVIDGSDTWFQTCGSGHLLYVECPGNPLVTWKRGYSTLFDILTKHIPKSGNGLQLPLSDRIILKKVVSKIYWNAGETGQARVTCEDGSVYEGDFVLVTCSLGFLKANANRLFQPELPEQKMRAIQGLGFGTVDKIYLKFDAPWWKSGWCGVSLLRKRSDNLDATSKDLPDDWTKNILGFYTVTNQPNFLVAWVSGAAARVMETLPASEVLAACTLLLRKIVKDDTCFHEPTQLIRSTWYSNPFTRGSYSYRSNVSKSSHVFAADLAEPLFGDNGEPVVLFAGEATHDCYYSTVHGAVESGYREAGRILELVKKRGQH